MVTVDSDYDYVPCFDDEYAYTPVHVEPTWAPARLTAETNYTTAHERRPEYGARRARPAAARDEIVDCDCNV